MRILVVLGFPLLAASAAAQAFSYNTIDDPSATSSSYGAPPATYAFGLNDSAVVVGEYSYGTYSTNAFKYSSGNFSDISFPGVCSGYSCGSEVRGINNSGEAVGDYTDDSGNEHGYLLENGSYSIFDFPGSTTTQPNAVNSMGVVVGIYQDGNYVQHGFFYNGSFNTYDCPLGGRPSVWGINDSGDWVGNCLPSAPPNNAFKFTAATGQYTPISFPGANSTTVWGINNAGQIVGSYLDAGNKSHGFLLSSGTYTTLDPPGSTYTSASAINNNGQIAGYYIDSIGVHGFLATPVQLVDPVPNLLLGSAVRPVNTTTDAQILATQGRIVQGVAADGVTEVVVEIPANNVGDQFTLTVLNDASQAETSSPEEDGALGSPGDKTFSRTDLTVTAVATSSSGAPNPMAFAIYRAPADFARLDSGGGYKSGTCTGTSMADNQAACRTVTIAIQNQGTGQTGNVPVLILRPPVALIHGLWGDPSDWNNFSPLFSTVAGTDPRFNVGLADYNGPPVAPIVSSTPDYSQFAGGLGKGVLPSAKANSLGFQYNAPALIEEITDLIELLKQGQNTAHTQIAATQADVVAHSMGGDISRTFPLVNNSSFGITVPDQTTFLSPNNFGQGSIHKLITIDSPNLGSPLATQLLNGQNGCVAGILASRNMPAFSSVQLAYESATISIPGAVGDLVDSPLSQALQNIAAPGQHVLPTALIAGTINSANLAGLATDATALGLQTTCGTLFRNPIALALPNWPSIFGNQANDAIVSLNSQLNGLSADTNSVFDGNLHSPGTETLGFIGPSVLDQGPVPKQVINLLNTPVTNVVFHSLNP